MFNDDFNPKPDVEIINGQEFHLFHPSFNILRLRREELGMSPQEVADLAGIKLYQYVALESGKHSIAATSFRIGLSVCDALRLDPHRFVPEITAP